MFNCCDLWEQMRIQKYYSKKRKCKNCSKITILNPILGLCPECTELEIRRLNEKIDMMLKEKEVEKIEKRGKLLDFKRFFLKILKKKMK